jgi:hypothetical protein
MLARSHGEGALNWLACDRWEWACNLQLPPRAREVI